MTENPRDKAIRELNAWAGRFDPPPPTATKPVKLCPECGAAKYVGEECPEAERHQSLNAVLVARGFATFTVTIRAADQDQAQRIAEAAAGLVRAEFQAITTEPAPPRWVSTEQDALARHLWSEFGTSAPGTHTFNEQDPSVQGWWMAQADNALRAVEEVPEAIEKIPATLVDPITERDALRGALERHIFDTCATWEAQFDNDPGRAVSVCDAAFAAAEFIADRARRP